MNKGLPLDLSAGRIGDVFCLPIAMQLDALPGPYIRRLQQIAVAIFLQETEGFGVTPIQYGTMTSPGRCALPASS